MSRILAAGMVLLALPALAGASERGDSTNRGRVTIRGTGSNVAIERTEKPAREYAGVAAAAGPLEDAVALKAGGATDATVIAFLRARQGELPPVIAAQDMKRLRKAGAGRSLAAYLATVAAVDIGETGEGHEALVTAEPISAPEAESVPYGMPYAYPIVGGYGTSPYPSRAVRRGFPHFPRMAPGFGRPLSRRQIPFRGTFSRLPFAP